MRYVDHILVAVGAVMLLIVLALFCMMAWPRLKRHIYFIGRIRHKGGHMSPAELYVFRLRILAFGSGGCNGVQWRDVGVWPPVYRTLAGFRR
jgi:hypothetical protein